MISLRSGPGIRRTSTAIALGLALLTSAARADPPAAEDQEIVACRDDAAKMCWEEKPGRAVLKCLKKHRAELSAECRAAVSKPKK